MSYLIYLKFTEKQARYKAGSFLGVGENSKY